jgi:hypothetical protein
MHPKWTESCLAAMGGLAIASTVSGAELSVPSASFPTIGSAVAAAQDGDVILVGPGTYAESALEIQAAVTIRSSAGPLATTLMVERGIAAKCFVSDPGAGKSVTIEGLTMVHAGGGALSGLLVVRGCRFVQCAPFGGLDMGATSSLVVERSSFEGCRDQLGAAIFVDVGAGSMQATDCVFLGNVAAIPGAPSEGGGLHLTNVPASLAGCTFVGNIATVGGAVLRWRNGPVANFAGCTFAENSSNWNCCVSCSNCGAAVASDWTVDCDEDGVPDRVAMLVWPQVDADGSGVPDVCECPGDLVADGIVNGADAAILLNFWGTDGSGYPGVDLDGDGIVGAADLTVLLNSWGACAE